MTPKKQSITEYLKNGTSVKMVKKADIVARKGLRSAYIGIVDKVIEIRGVKIAIVRWIVPTPINEPLCLFADSKFYEQKKKPPDEEGKKQFQV